MTCSFSDLPSLVLLLAVSMTSLSSSDYFEALLSATLHLKCFTRLVSTIVAIRYVAYHFVVEKMAVGLSALELQLFYNSASREPVYSAVLSCGLKLKHIDTVNYSELIIVHKYTGCC